MGFFKQVASALKPSGTARERDTAGDSSDAGDDPSDAGDDEATLEAMTPEERTAYEGNAAAVARTRAEAEASREQAKAARDDDGAA